MIVGPIYKVDSKGKIRVLSIEVESNKFRVISGLEDGAKITNNWTTVKGKNIGRANATTDEEQALQEANAKITIKLKNDYFLTKEEATKSDDFSCMLATDSDKVDMDKVWSENEYVIVDPKLDGMRLTDTHIECKSRRGRPVLTAAWIHEELLPFLQNNPNIVLDGEIYNHTYRDNFEDLMSLARRDKLSPEDEVNSRTLLQYHIYDMVDLNNLSLSAIERKEWLTKHIPVSDRIHVVRYEKVYNAQELEKANEYNLSLGYEGSVVRIPNAPYKYGRGKVLLKVKKFTTDEFTIIDILPGKGNRANTAGTVVVNVNGIEVGCGLRGTWAQTADLLSNKNKYLNKDATVRFFGYTADGSLRFPVCIDIDRWKHE